MEFDVKQLRPVGISDRAFFQAKLAIKESRSCECAFANLVLWQEPYQEEFVVVDGRIAVIERKTGVLHFPIGEYFAPQELAELCDAFRSAGPGNGTIYDVPEDYPAAAEWFDESANEGEFDYLYDLKHLAEMNGPLLRKKRNLVRQFERAYPDYRLEAVTRDNLDITLNLATELNRRLHHVDFLDEEEIAMNLVHRDFDALGMGGVLLYAAGSPAGFSLYSRINRDTADIHFEKADHTVKGAPQMLTAKLAEHLLTQSFLYMNREQDMDEPGLRQAKRSLDPCCMVKRQSFRRRG